MSIDIGIISVHRGEPPGGNPYRGSGRGYGEFRDDPVTSLMGDERSHALGRFVRGLPTEGYTFWVTPNAGGARRLAPEDHVEVNVVQVEYYWLADGTPRRVR